MNYKAIIHDSQIGRWRAFNRPKEIIKSNEVDQIIPLLTHIENQVSLGLWAIGFISYEAAAAFDTSCSVLADADFPKIWFALFEESEIIDLPKSSNNFYLGAWQSEIEDYKYYENIKKIKEQIKRGNSYQANYTFRQNTTFRGDDIDCFLAFIERQSTEYGAYIDCDDFSICSASPELFFSKIGNRITTKPMKGTAARLENDNEDQVISQNLKQSIKERSENVMIVDMIRNDLSRIAIDNSVKAISLFDLEQFETLWQMTSTIEAYSQKSIAEILTALFPCASITGAPKCSTMKIISRLEASPRKIYTGTIGLLSPDSPRYAQFSVAIRTILIDKTKHIATYGVGSGIVWECDDVNEYRECLLKAEATPNSSENLELLETMLWTPENRFYLLEAHLNRLEESAKFFNFICDKESITNYMHIESANWDIISSQKVRLLLSSNGEYRYEIFPYTPTNKILKVAIAKSAVNSTNIYLRHKTTERRIYQSALQEFSEHDDVILWNERGEITESCIGNIAYKLGDTWYTPPLESGILNGTYRQMLINNQKLIEKILLKNDFQKVDEIAILNSVRGWSKAEISI